VAEYTLKLDLTAELDDPVYRILKNWKGRVAPRSLRSRQAPSGTRTRRRTASASPDHVSDRKTAAPLQVCRTETLPPGGIAKLAGNKGMVVSSNSAGRHSTDRRKAFHRGDKP
jgi:hypothetical protein